MKNKRHFERFSIDGMDVCCRLMSGAEAFIVKLTHLGAKVLVKERMSVGSEYALQLEHAGRKFRIPGVVVAQELAGSEENRKSEEQTAFMTAIVFNHPAKGHEETFRKLIDELQKQTASKDKRNLKTSIASGRTPLNPQGAYHITQISFGGMQIETDAAIKINSVLHLCIQLGQGKECLTLLGRVATCIAVEGARKFKVGIEYIDMKNKDLLRLKDLIYYVEGLTETPPQ